MYIRSLHPKHFDEQEGEFVGDAFEASSDGGVSVICERCILDSGATVCSHLERFYAKIAHEPPIFWRFDSDCLPPDTTVHIEDSHTGDDCHRNIRARQDDRSKPGVRKFKKISRSHFKSYGRDFDRFYICDPATGARNVRRNELASLSLPAAKTRWSIVQLAQTGDEGLGS